jgi:uncharacterized cupin superfamily protein
MLASDSTRLSPVSWPGFVDVGNFARAAVAPLATQAGREYLERRRWLDLPPGPITVAAVTVGAGEGHELTLPGEEFVMVLDGQLTLRQGGVELELAANEHALVLRDLPLEWSSDVGAQLIVLRCTAGGTPTLAQPVKIDTTATLAPSNAPLAELLIGPTPQCRSHAAYRSPTAEFVCGVWDSTPYHRRPMLFQHFELMHLLAGSVTFIDSSGAAGTFRSGDVVLFVRGGTVSWESREHVKKAYAWFRST